MFSIKDIGNNEAAKSYYQHEDYYTKEAVGSANDKQWFGKATKALGLRDEQFKEQLKQILNGRIDALNIKVGNKKHIPGYDLTFSPPKSVSIQSEVVGDTRIREAHTQAVKSVLEYIESSKMIYTRKTVNGKTHYESIDKLAFGLVLHNTSRSLDPQLHTHAILANMVQRSDGIWRSGCFEKLYENQQVLKRMYRTELAHLLTNLGYTVEIKNQKEVVFEISEVPKALISKFSTRRQAIEKALEWYEHVNAKTTANATLVTRQAKQEISREELHANWEKVVSNVGLNLDELKRSVPKAIKEEASINQGYYDPPSNQNTSNTSNSQKLTDVDKNEQQVNIKENIKAAIDKIGLTDKAKIRHLNRISTPQEKTPQAALDYAIKHLSERSSIWGEGSLITTAASFAIGVLSKQDIKQQIELYKKAGVLLEAKAHHQNMPEEALTTKEMLDLELKNIKLMRAAKDTQKAIYDSRELSKAILEYGLNKGQIDSVLLLLTTKDRIVGVQGYAGTGKTFMMRAASDLALRRGIELIGLAPSSSAARTLEQETNIPSHTLSRFLVQYNIVLQKWVNPKRIDLLKERFKNKLIILDEASLISSKQMYDFSRITNILNVRVVLSGDIKQCNAIEAGNPFEQFQKAGMKTARMKKIIRQTDIKLKEVVIDTAKGNIERAYNKSVIEEIPGKNRVLAAQAIGTWESKSIEERKNTIITVTSRELRNMCNEGIRDILKKEGALTETPKLISVLQSRDLTHAQMEYANSYRRGDVILFNKDFSDFNIKRGQYYNVFKVKEDNILILKQKFFSKYVKADLIAKDKGAIEVYHRQDLELQKGDTIRWTRNNKIDKDIVNSERATVVKINKFSIEFTLANGTSKKIKVNDNTLKHLDYAYTSTIYAAQGKTAEESLNILPSISAQSSQKTFYVASSRAKSAATVITNKYEKDGEPQTLLDHLLTNTGTKISAAEHQGIDLSLEEAKPKTSKLKQPTLPLTPQSELIPKDTNIKDSKISQNKIAKALYHEKKKEPQYSTKEIYQSLFMRLPSLLPEFGFEYKGGKLISSTGQRINGEVGKSKGKVYVYENNPGVLIDYTGTNKTIWDYLKEGRLASSNSKEIMDYLLQYAGLGGGKFKVTTKAHNPKVREELTINVKTEVDSKLVKTILEFSQKNLIRKDNEVLTYLKKERGYSLDTIKKMELGYINSKAALGAYLRKLGFSNDKVKEAYNMLHLIGKSHNFIIPYKDKEGNPIGFAGRNINHDSSSTVGKYLYTRGLSINSTMLNLHNVKKNGEITVVEGVLDCLHAYAKGIPNIVALGGTGFNKNHLKYLEEKGIHTVTLCLDNDKAGITASQKIAVEISKHLPHISVKQAALPNNIKDPDQMLKELGEQAFQAMVAEAKIIKQPTSSKDTVYNNQSKTYYKEGVEIGV